MRLFRHRPSTPITFVCWGVPNMSTAVVTFTHATDGHVLIMARDAFGSPRVIYDSRREAENEVPIQ